MSSTERRTPRTRRGPEAVEAALEEREILERVDDPDGALRSGGDYDLSWVREQAGSTEVAAGADHDTPDEALEDLARPLAHQDPEEEPLEEDDGYDH